MFHHFKSIELSVSNTLHIRIVVGGDFVIVEFISLVVNPLDFENDRPGSV